MAKLTQEINPFVQIGSGFHISAVYKAENLVTQGTAQQGQTANQLRVYRVETDERTSLYTDGLLSWFPMLSTAAKDMLVYIASRVRFKSDVIELTEERYCAAMNVSRTTFFTAKRELINRLIVPRTSRKNTYWINPAIMFKGDRMDVYPDNVRMENEHPFKKYNSKEEFDFTEESIDEK